MSAKPIIDIVIGVVNLEQAERFAPPMESIGYDYTGDGGVPGHGIFGRGARLRTHLVHAVIFKGQEWTSHIALRDALRSDPRLVHDYTELRTALAAEFPTDRPGHTRAKGRIIERILHGTA